MTPFIIKINSNLCKQIPANEKHKSKDKDKYVHKERSNNNKNHPVKVGPIKHSYL